MLEHGFAVCNAEKSKIDIPTRKYCILLVKYWFNHEKVATALKSTDRPIFFLFIDVDVIRDFHSTVALYNKTVFNSY